MKRRDDSTTRPIADPIVEWTATRIPDPVLRLRFLRAFVPPPENQSKSPKHLKKIGLTVAGLCVVLAPWSLRFVSAQEPAASPAVAPIRVPTPAADPPANVWQVEKTSAFDLYSNGLRIENQYEAGNRPRSYLAFPLDAAGATGVPTRTQPAGIVFHTTESLQAPFEPGQNTVLKRVSESLLEYVRRRRAYNFLIDRFGRVYRIVRESDAANHSGHSIWADDTTIYVNLNDSFLGVSFEAETGAAESVSPAQIRAAAMLTEMLRSRYSIQSADCVTHAQVSVNPANYQIGYHTDWASSFPFERLGLPDNYARPLPSLALFGFEYDSAFVERAGPRLAETARQSLASDRKPLRARYTRLAHATAR